MNDALTPDAEGNFRKTFILGLEAWKPGLPGCMHSLRLIHVRAV